MHVRSTTGETFGEIDVRQPEPDLFVWQTGHGRTVIVDATDTHDLGTGAFARIVWNSAAAVSTIPLPAPDLIGPRRDSGRGEQAADLITDGPD